jgi:ketosteroid isomerase-like protein
MPIPAQGSGQWIAAGDTEYFAGNVGRFLIRHRHLQSVAILRRRQAESRSLYDDGQVRSSATSSFRILQLQQKDLCMKKLTLLVGFLCLFTGYVAAASPDETDVAAAVDRLTQAMWHKDIAQLNALTAENLTYGHSSGNIQDKRAFIADIETGKSAFNELKMLNQKITLSGDVALVRNHFSAQAVNSGKVVPTEIENFQIWQKQNGEWLLIGRQAFRF